ncbi:copper homeostasis periplasmic binding protein CopC [Sphingomonas sp. ID1715]|uniref:copper homeostasis periplasmic binding protein CopC n=1 Tax=Sphingomonas sp. ID1715 TaxID=1656898 RepID=UPI001489BD32|nr:copper homeostasis periplasmic binding protein CopC [Sphingomonas sp. ID1715]NNM77787.1 copper homeostasis periplasmic binding protein CopC [Sphingomonas sp. ID1715]
MRSLRLSFALTAASALFVAGTAAQAHPKLVSATPAANATVSRTAKIELHFSEKLVGQFSGVDLVMTDMPGMKMNGPMKMNGVAVAVGPDGKTLVATLKAPLPAGSYKLDWHAVSADTHRVNGSYTFQVK